MIAPALLLMYAVVIGTVGAPRLARAEWPQRSPRLGIWAWQTLSLSIVLAVVLAGATLAVPTLTLSNRLADLLDACLLAIRDQYSTPGGAVVASVGGIVVVAVVGRLMFVLTRQIITTARRRDRQRRQLAVVAARDAATGALVLPHDTPTVYCLPGRGGVVVFTSAAVELLDARQQQAVLAHERAHLDGRHDAVLVIAAVLRAAFPFVLTFSLAQAQIQRLIEMRADDAAAGTSERQLLASALVALAEGAVPPTAIGAGGDTALTRVHRLTEPADPVPRPWALAGAAVAVVILMVPLGLAVGPGVLAALLDYCPPNFR